MIVNIHTPSYFSKHHEQDEEITVMSEDIKNFFKDREYSEKIKNFDIVPVVAPRNILDAGLWPEDIMYSKAINRISIFKHIDYEKYLNGSVEERKKLTVKCVIDAAHDIKSKKGTKFDYVQFKSDLLAFCNYKESDFEKIMKINAIKNDVNTESPSLEKNYTLRVNKADLFKNGIVSFFSIKEALAYVEESAKAGENEFLVLENTRNKLYIQCFFENDSYVVQAPISVDSTIYKLAEKNKLEKNEVVDLFVKFYENSNYLSQYFTNQDIKEGSNSFQL